MKTPSAVVEAPGATATEPASAPGKSPSTGVNVGVIPGTALGPAAVASKVDPTVPPVAAQPALAGQLLHHVMRDAENRMSASDFALFKAIVLRKLAETTFSGAPSDVGYAVSQLIQSARKELEATKKAAQARPPGPGKPVSAPTGAPPSPAQSGTGRGGKNGGGSGGGSPPVAQGPGDGDGKPGKYRGGRHRDTTKPPNDDLHSHHMPADSVNGLKKGDGPAIQMEPADHEKTASHAYQGAAGLEFRTRQQRLIKQGRFGGAAIQMEIDDKPWMREGLKG